MEIEASIKTPTRMSRERDFLIISSPHVLHFMFGRRLRKGTLALVSISPQLAVLRESVYCQL